MKLVSTIKCSGLMCVVAGFWFDPGVSSNVFLTGETLGRFLTMGIS